MCTRYNEQLLNDALAGACVLEEFPVLTVMNVLIQALSNTAAFTLKVHEGLTHKFDFVINQWKKDIASGTQVILGMCKLCSLNMVFEM